MYVLSVYNVPNYILTVHSEVPTEILGAKKSWPLPFLKVCFYEWNQSPSSRIADTASCVLLNPEFSGSPLVKDFVFS